MTIEYSGESFSGYNKPKRTSSHPTKSHAVLAKVGNLVRLIRFGQQGVSGAGKNPKTDAQKARRRSFKARHAKNIARGKMSAAYWADKVKWNDMDDAVDIEKKVLDLYDRVESLQLHKPGGKGHNQRRHGARAKGSGGGGLPTAVTNRFPHLIGMGSGKASTTPEFSRMKDGKFHTINKQMNGGTYSVQKTKVGKYRTTFRADLTPDGQGNISRGFSQTHGTSAKAKSYIKSNYASFKGTKRYN